MYEISTLYPTKIVKALGFNYGRYIKKLAKPDDFSIGEILLFSHLIGVDPNKVIEITLKETTQNVSKAISSSKSISSSKKKREASTPKKAPIKSRER